MTTEIHDRTHERVSTSSRRTPPRKFGATISTFKGHRIADLRVWTGDENDVNHPTKKGLALKVEHLPRLLQAIEKLMEAGRAP